MKRFWRWIAAPLAMSAGLTLLFVTCLGASMTRFEARAPASAAMVPQMKDMASLSDEGGAERSVAYEMAEEVPPPAPSPSAEPPSRKAMMHMDRAGDGAPAGGVVGGLVEGKGKGGGEGSVEAPTRSWFPETFLFDPLVVTDESGRATVPVRVPDRSPDQAPVPSRPPVGPRWWRSTATPTPSGRPDRAAGPCPRR